MPDPIADIAFRSAASLGRDMSRGHLSSRELALSLLARIERLDPALNSFVTVDRDAVLREAEAADAMLRSTGAKGPLHGVPVALKDLIEIEGGITTAGSGEWRGRRSARTATIVERLRAAGMIVLGKAQTVEFAHGGWGINPLMGTPRNPWGESEPHAPGGSSSGSAALIAAGLSPLAIGTDTSGSIRIPAAFCGVTGLKPTRGRISTHGILPLAPSLDTPGPMARSVEDCALLYAALRGPDPRDPATLELAADDPLGELKRGVEGLRIARLPESERDGVAPAILAAYDRSLDHLANSGARIVEIALPFPLAVFLEAQPMVQAEAWHHYGALASDPATKLDPAVRERLLAGRNISASAYLANIEAHAQRRRDVDRAFADIDAFLTPGTPMTAPALADVDQSVKLSRFFAFTNYLGYCGLGLPSGFDESGMPTGVHVVAGPFREAMALRVGHALQQAGDYHLRRPPIAI